MIFFTMRMMRYKNRLPREFVDTPSLEVFQTRLDLVGGSPPMAEGLEVNDF